MKTATVSCCIAGGGPAGMMLGLLLARQGTDVMVLEKHADFLRDFRGDTIHPSTLQLMSELGLADELLQLPHTELSHITVEMATGPVTLIDFRRLPGRFRSMAYMPQWDFLNFLSERALRYPSFRLLTRSEATGLVETGDRVVGVRAQTPEGPLEVRADLVVAADGRHSTLRRCAGLEPVAKSSNMDVLWFRLSRRPGEQATFLRRGPGGGLICIDRGEFWQLGQIIPAGSYDAVHGAGLDALRASVAALAPTLADRVTELRDWDDVKLLTVQVDRLRRWWRPGLLCIGDAAHAMSPAGGVGINLAIQDAVAAANILGPSFRAGGPGPRDLQRVQRRRELPARLTQWVQLHGIRGVPRPSERAPLAMRLFRRLPALRHLAGWFVGIGLRPEHVRRAGESQGERTP